MKYLFRTFSLYLAILLGSCNSFDQETFDQGLQDAQAPDYIIPTTVPTSENQFELLLHGSEKNQWVAEEFTLEGLLGFQDCRLDDTMTLNEDGTYLFDGGEMLCGGGDVATKSGVYKLDYENKRLIFDEGTAEKIEVNVSGLDEGIIAVDSKVDIFGISMTITGVYTVQ